LLPESVKSQGVEMAKTVVVLLAGIISISFASIFIKLCDDVPAIMIATYRLSIASVILCVYYTLRGHSFTKIDKIDLLLALLGGLFLSFHFITWISSLKYTSVASSVVLVATNPIFVGVLSYFLLKEKQHLVLVIGIVLCFMGSIMIAIGDSGLGGAISIGKQALIGDILALLGAFMASGYLIVGSKARERLDITTYVTLVFTISALFLLLTSFMSRIPFFGYKPSSYLFMVLLAVVPQLIGHTSINWALKHLKTSMVAISILGEPVGATILAYIIFRESVGAIQLVGIALIFAAILIASKKGGK
jgi:drug/metabolite transporter (DMT)-like permease